MSFIYIYFVTNCQGLHTKLKRLFLKIIFLWFYLFCHFVQSLMVKGNSFTKVNWFVHIAQILCLMFIELMSLPIPQFSGSHCNSLSMVRVYIPGSPGLAEFHENILIKIAKPRHRFIVYCSCWEEYTLCNIHKQSMFIKPVYISCGGT